MVSPRTFYKATYVTILLALFPIAIFRSAQIAHSLQFFHWQVFQDIDPTIAPITIDDQIFLPLELSALALLFIGLIFLTIRTNPPPFPKSFINNVINDEMSPTEPMTAKWWRAYRRMGVDNTTLLTYRLGRGLVSIGSSFLFATGILRVSFEVFFTPTMSIHNFKTEYILTYVLVSLEFLIPAVLYLTFFHNDPARLPSHNIIPPHHTQQIMGLYDTACDIDGTGDFLQSTVGQYLPPSAATTHLGMVSSDLSLSAGQYGSTNMNMTEHHHQSSQQYYPQQHQPQSLHQQQQQQQQQYQNNGSYHQSQQNFGRENDGRLSQNSSMTSSSVNNDQDDDLDMDSHGHHSGQHSQHQPQFTPNQLAPSAFVNLSQSPDFLPPQPLMQSRPSTPQPQQQSTTTAHTQHRSYKVSHAISQPINSAHPTTL